MSNTPDGISGLTVLVVTVAAPVLIVLSLLSLAAGRLALTAVFVLAGVNFVALLGIYRTVRSIAATVEGITPAEQAE